MGINLSLPRAVELKPRIVVIGVGGAGGNAVNNMINSGLDGVDFIAANTDAQALAFSKADCRVAMGGGITQGLGAGMRPEVGEKSAEDSLAEILEHLDGTHMLFIAAGMGGGTGTGAAPVIARAARERGILTVAIVTKPFQFEGSRRMAIAEEGIERLEGCVDTLITIPNQNLFRVATEQTTMSDAFAMADEVLYSGVRGITDLMVVPGLINLDFNDVRTVMDQMGKAMMGTGEATGERRSIEAAESAISNPLLDDVSLKGARGVLINITGGRDLTLYEVDEAASLIRGQVDEDANIIIGSALDSELDGIVRVSVVATGVGEVTAYNRAAVEASGSRSDFTPRQQQDAVRSVLAEPAQETASQRAPQNNMAKTSFSDRETEPAYLNASAMAGSASNPAAAVKTENAPPPMPAAEPREEQRQVQNQTSNQRVAEPEPAKQVDYSGRNEEAQTIVKRPFGFFNRKKSVPISPAHESTRSAAPKQPAGDLFGEELENELEIPSFLRRHT